MARTRCNFDQANNYWVAAVSLGYKGGKRVRRKVFGRTKTEVKAKLREFRKITQAAGLGTDWVPREMRHTFVSLLSSNGTALEDIAGNLGVTYQVRDAQSSPFQER
jgi:hypothetical protein